MEYYILLKTVIPAVRTSLSVARPSSAYRIARPSFERMEPTAIPRLECTLFRSGILPDDRIVSVYLPPQYASEPDRTFPVFYLHDGQNLFDPRTSYIPGHTWRVNETADRLNAQGEMEPVIFVGVANTGLRRMAEYTPTRDYRMGGGEGNDYGRLLREELKPWVDRTYRTRTDAANTALGGSSLGGLITLFVGLQHPEIFGKLAVLSPSIWWDQRSILSYVTKSAVPKPEVKIWLDIGTAEGLRHVRDAELLNQRLIKLGWQPGVDLDFLKVDGGFHSEDAWADRFNQVLEFLFPA
jgi:predicted alpha/beta superfamily hydrolase